MPSPLCYETNQQYEDCGSEERQFQNIKNTNLQFLRV